MGLQTCGFSQWFVVFLHSEKSKCTRSKLKCVTTHQVRLFSSFIAEASGAGAIQVNTGRRCCICNIGEHGEFRFISQLVARPYRPLRIYSTLLHYIKAYVAMGSFGNCTETTSSKGSRCTCSNAITVLNGLNTAGMKTPLIKDTKAGPSPCFHLLVLMLWIQLRWCCPTKR